MTTTTDDATRLSTAPAPPSAPRPSRTAPLLRAWRSLVSMRTALLLLFLLALASVPGSFLPQRNLNPVEVQTFFAEHPTLAPLLDRLSGFDVFASPWFAAVYLLLFVSLIGCLSSRLRLHARALLTPPPDVPRVLSRLPVHERWSADAPAEQVLAAARRALRRRRWRVVTRALPGGGHALSAEKGYLRETGNLLFHVSLVVLLVGIATGGLYGFKGTVLVKEGDGFANTVFAYDDISPGRRFDAEPAGAVQLRPRRVLGRPTATTASRSPSAPICATPTRSTRRARRTTLRVNAPLHVGGAKTYLIGHGYAPKVVVTDVEGNRLEQTVVCLPQGATFLSTCAIKVPDARGEPLAFEGVFTPTTVQDPETARVTSVFPAPENPALTVLGYRGDLGLDDGRPQSVYSLEDRSGLRPIGDGRTPVKLAEGQTWRLPGGGSLTFVETTEWATFQVTQDPGKIVALVAGTGMVLGLCLSLFVRRRRLWLRAVPAPDDDPAGRTVVEAGGLARTGAEAFDAEFAALVARLRTTDHPAHPVEEHA